jgi:hypothetical protein
VDAKTPASVHLPSSTTPTTTTVVAPPPSIQLATAAASQEGGQTSAENEEETSPKFAVSDSELFRLIPAPDFPTGGIIMGTAASQKVITIF